MRAAGGVSCGLRRCSSASPSRFEYNGRGFPDMQRTRKIDIADRVLTIPDLLRFAKILDGQVHEDPKAQFKTIYEVSFADNLSLEGSAAEVLTEEELNRPSRPVAIEMRLRSTQLVGDRYIRISLRADSTGYGNGIVVSSEDADWMNANVAALHDAVQKIQPQSFWWNNHRTLLLHLLAIGIGSSIDLTLAIIVILTLRLYPGLADKVRAVTLPGWLIAFYRSPLGSSWFLRWLMGMPWAPEVRTWILSAWPRIEFDFGSPYLRPVNKRNRIKAVWTLVVVPTLVAALYDLFRIAIR